MFIFGNLMLAAAYVFDIALTVYMWVIIVAAIVSWVSPDPYNPIVRFLHSVTDPALKPIRRIVGYRLGPIDISPLIVILVIIFIQKFLIGSLMELGYRVKG